MKNRFIFSTLAWLLFLQVLFPHQIHAQVIGNCTVNAGGNAIICGTSTTLTGGVSGSIGAGTPTWTFLSGPVTPTIVSPNSLTTSVTGMVEDGAYRFRLSHPCTNGIATSTVTITAHPRPATFTAGPDITNVCATTGITTLAGVIPAGFTGEWRAVNIFSLVRFGTQVSTNAQFSSTNNATPVFSLINKANHEIDPAYYVILKITSLDGICSYEDTAIVNFIPNPVIVAPTTVSSCRTPASTSHYFDLNATTPAFATAYAGSAGTVASGNNVSLTVISQPPGGNLGYESIQTRRVYLSGLDVDGTYTFTLTVTNDCGSYTTPPISYTYSGTYPRNVIFQLASHPEQLVVYSSGSSGGELHCSDKIGDMTPEYFYFDIDTSDPASVTTVITPSGAFPPGGAPTINLTGAGTHQRMVTVTPPSGGWQAGTYAFNINARNGTCGISQSYYIHISDNNRPDVSVPDQSVCYPGTGTVSAVIPLPDVYKQVVNPSYFQDFNGYYELTSISRPSGAATPTYTPTNLRSITSTHTTISNLNRAGDYIFGIRAIPSGGGVGPFLDREYDCSGSSLVNVFTIHVENPVNSNAGSDQSGICDQQVSLLGNAPGAGTGVWTITTAPTGALPVIVNPSAFSTTAVNLDSIGEYRFKWTITSPLGGCVSEDEVSYLVTCALPVTLTDFKATSHAAAIILDWSTASEHNSKGFEIQRSGNGQDWYPIGYTLSKAANGNSSSKLEYSHKDIQPLYGHNYYRLRQQDLDGKDQYSSVRMVQFGTASGISIYPNPAWDRITIKGYSGNGHVQIFDMAGRVLKNIHTHSSDPEIAVDDLHDGVYQIILHGIHGESIKQKLVITR